MQPYNRPGFTPPAPTPPQKKKGSLGELLASSLVLGVLGGSLAIFGPCCLGLGEQFSLDSKAGAAEGVDKVKSVSSKKVKKSNNNKLIHVTGPVKTDGKVSDPDFGVEQDGIGIFRHVEMFQWDEDCARRRKLVCRRYEYDKEWSGTRNRSESFDDPYYRNPKMAVAAKEFTGQTKVGAFKVEHDFGGKKNKVEVDDSMLASARRTTGMRAHKRGDHQIYLGDDPARPRIGDLRVTFTVTEAPTGVVSVLGKQDGKSIVPYKTKSGVNIFMVTDGKKSAKSMLKTKKDGAEIGVWCTRIFGTFFLFLGLVLVFEALTKWMVRLDWLASAKAGRLFFAAGTAAGLAGLTVAGVNASQASHIAFGGMGCGGGGFLVLGALGMAMMAMAKRKA